MFKIGEFSKITQVSVRMLRYYDEQKLLEPYIIDDTNGYRFYSAKQIDELNKIILLRDMGFGVKDIRSFLNEWSSDLVKQNLKKQMAIVEENIRAEEMKLYQIKGRLKDLDHEAGSPEIKIIMKQLPEQQVLSLRKVVKDYYCESVLWEELARYLKDIKNTDSLSGFTIYHDLDYREENVDIEICVSMDHVDKVVKEHIDTIIKNKELTCRKVERVEFAACFMVYGPYSNISRAYQDFALWLEMHKEYHMAGENRQICHVAVNMTDNPEEYVTELQIPLALNT